MRHRGAMASANLQRLDEVCIEQIIRMVAMMAMWMITMRITMMVKLMMPGFVLATVLPQRERSVRPNLAKVDFCRFVRENLY